MVVADRRLLAIWPLIRVDLDHVDRRAFMDICAHPRDHFGSRLCENVVPYGNKQFRYAG